MVKNTLTSIVTAAVVSIVVVILALAGGSKPQPVTPVTQDEKSFASQLETTRITLGGGADVLANSQGGGLIFKGMLSTTSAMTTGVIPARNISDYNTISYTPRLPNVTLQLPASTTFPQSFLPRAGDRTRVLFLNSTTTTTGALNNVGFAGGTGTLVKVASTTPANTASTTGQTGMYINIVRKPNTDLLFLFENYK